jgi:hypothetical protein
MNYDALAVLCGTTENLLLIPLWGFSLSPDRDKWSSSSPYKLASGKRFDCGGNMPFSLYRLI